MRAAVAGRWIGASAAAALLCGCGRGAEPVAVIDMEAVLKGYRKAQAVHATLDKEKRDLEKKGQGMLDEIDALVKEPGILDEEARRERETLIREKSAAVELFRRTAPRTLMDKTGEEYATLMGELRAAAGAFARRRGIRVIVDSSAVAYAGEGMDMTREVVEELNRRLDKKGGER